MTYKPNLIASIVIIIAAIALGIFIFRRHVAAPAAPQTISQGTNAAQTSDRTFPLACDGGKKFTLTFHLPEDKSVDLALSDGRALNLLNTSSEAAASYSSADGKTVLAIGDNALNLTENGAITYGNCMPDASAVQGAQ